MASIFRPNPETGGRTLNPKFVLVVVSIFTFVSLTFFLYYNINKESKILDSSVSSTGVGNTSRSYSQLLTGTHADKKEKNAKLKDYADSIADPKRGEFSSSILKNMQENLEIDAPVSNLGDEIFIVNDRLDSLSLENDKGLSGYVPFSQRESTNRKDNNTRSGSSNGLSLISVSSGGKSARDLFYSDTNVEIPEETEADLRVLELEESINLRISSQEKMFKDLVLEKEKLQKSMEDKDKELQDLKDSKELERNSNSNSEITSSSVGGGNSFKGEGISANSVPTGTNIPVVLLQDVVTTNRNQYVWVQVAQEVIFRNQVQLPKGVRIRGDTSGSIREMVDINFDLMVFPDGTELRLDATAVNGFDPRFPNMYKLQGITGTYVVPPVWTKLLPIFIEAAIGYSDNNREFRQPSGNTGSTASTETAESTPPPEENERINEAINSASSALGQMVIEDLERYQPYVRLNRGQSFFVQTNSTLDFSNRTLGGMGGTSGGSSVSTVDNLMSEVGDNSEFTTELDLPDEDSPLELPNGISSGLRNSIESYLSD